MRKLPDFIRSNALARFVRPYRRAMLRELAARRFRPLDDDDRARIDFYSQFVKKNDLVFDVGANLGNRTKAFLELGAEVVAFEPQTVCADFLQTAFMGNKKFRLVRKALGSGDGSANMLLSDAHFLSSLNPSWIEAVKTSGRFSSVRWDKSEVVEVTTLDAAIRGIGAPSFIKIDVEGYEKHVVSGLSRPIKFISIEFTAEYIEASVACIDHLESLSRIEGQMSYGESMTLTLPSWQPPAELKATLSRVHKLAVGDVYVRSMS